MTTRAPCGQARLAGLAAGTAAAAAQADEAGPALCWRPAGDGAFAVHGLAWFKENDGAFLRLPRRAAAINPKAWAMAHHPAGARVRFRTDATTLRLRIDHGGDSFPWPMMSSLAMAGIELYEGAPGQEVFRAVVTPASAAAPYEVSLTAPAERTWRDCTLYLPMYARLKALDIGLDAAAGLAAPTPLRLDRPVVFYGSSFVQGACAARGSMAYPAILGRRLGVDIVNLGFAGDGTCEADMAACLADIDAASFVMGPILNDLPLMQERYAAFIDILRRQRPQMPIVLMTRLHTLGQREPYAVNAIVEAVYARHRERGDRLIHLVDAYALYGDGSEYPTCDGVHPTDHGFRRIADALEPVLLAALRLPPLRAAPHPKES